MCRIFYTYFIYVSLQLSPTIEDSTPYRMKFNPDLEPLGSWLWAACECHSKWENTTETQEKIDVVRAAQGQQEYFPFKVVERKLHLSRPRRRAAAAAAAALYTSALQSLYS